MKRAWMPVAAAAIGAIGLPGCDTASFSSAWLRGDASTRQTRIASDPISSPYDAQTPTQTAASPADDSSHIAQQVQDFLARFPGDTAAPAAPRAPAAADQVAAASPPPPPGFVRNSARLGLVAPLESSPRFMTAEQPTAPDGAAPDTAAAVPAMRGPASAEPAAPSPNAPAATAMTATPTAIPGPGPAPQMAAQASPTTPALPPAERTPLAAPRIELLEVRAVAPATASQPAGSGANQPVAPGSAAPAGGLDALIAALENTVRLHPQQLDDQFRLRLLYAASGQEERAMGLIEGVDPVQGELMAAVLRAVVTARKSIQDPINASAAAIQAADELRRLLGHQAPVIVPRLALVTRVNSFGDYQAVDPPRFPAGRPVHVFLYTEVKNFRSEVTADNRLRTLLAEKVEIFDASGRVVWQRSEPNIEDRSISPRSDFFMTMEIVLPADLAPGEYVLKVTVEDRLGATTDQQRLTFTIAAE